MIHIYVYDDETIIFHFGILLRKSSLLVKCISSRVHRKQDGWAHYQQVWLLNSFGNTFYFLRFIKLILFFCLIDGFKLKTIGFTWTYTYFPMKICKFYYNFREGRAVFVVKRKGKWKWCKNWIRPTTQNKGIET